MQSWVHNPRLRSVAIQSIVVVIIVWFGYEVITNTIVNLQKQKIASGFDFLNTTAGFGIIQTLIPYSEESTYGRAFVVGLLNTLLVSVLAIGFATFLGFVIGLARLSQNWLIAKLALVFVEIVRNIPPLLHLFFWYFAVLRALPHPRQSLSFGESVFFNNRGIYIPRLMLEEGALWPLWACLIVILAVVIFHYWLKTKRSESPLQIPLIRVSLALIIGFPVVVFFITGLPLTLDMPELKGLNFTGGMKIIPEFVALLLALSIYTAAYIAEIVRGGVLAVNKGQTEAAYSLGLRPFPVLRWVVIPQALRVIIPPLTNQYLNLTKNSSLAVAIAYPDLVSVFAGTSLSQTGQAVEILAMTMAVYLTLSLLTALIMNWFNARMALVER